MMKGWPWHVERIGQMGHALRNLVVNGKCSSLWPGHRLEGILESIESGCEGVD